MKVKENYKWIAIIKFYLRSGNSMTSQKKWKTVENKKLKKQTKIIKSK